MKINNIEVKGDSFAYDGCHKIYILEDENDKNEALENDYNIFELNKLEEKYNESCNLRFIYNWKLDKKYIMQFEEAIFESNNVIEM